MINKAQATNRLTKVYKRASKSPFNDHSTILILASVQYDVNEDAILDYSRYIYLHRSVDGTVCGISISKLLLSEWPDYPDRYMKGDTMLAFLLDNIEEICVFLEQFKDDFIELFMIDPLAYFTAAEEYWTQRLSFFMTK